MVLVGGLRLGDGGSKELMVKKDVLNMEMLKVVKVGITTIKMDFREL